MKCQNDNCKNEGHLLAKDDKMVCWSCNDQSIVDLYHSEPDCDFIKPVAELPELAPGFVWIDNSPPSFISNDVPKENPMTLPTNSQERKEYPLFRGCLRYFPAALAGVARISKLGNDKHNPGEDMYHARGKSSDHGDCILRHLTDTEDLLVAKERGQEVTEKQILDEASQMAWRALAYCQELHERFGAPLAPGAKK